MGDQKKPLMDPTVPRFRVPKPPPQTMTRNEFYKYMKMSKETWDDDGANHDHLKEDIDIDNLIILSSNIDNLRGKADNDVGEVYAKPLHEQIAKLEVELLTAKRALLRRQNRQQDQPSVSAIAEPCIRAR